jgi:hypothetical protein
MENIHLYIDESGSRNPDNSPTLARIDGIDAFSFGGFLINAEDIDSAIASISNFKEKWGIKYPLHSRKIRSARDEFGWLNKCPVRREEFMSDLDSLIITLPIVCIAAVVHRPGYVERYKSKYNNQLWLMCKTAYSVLIERSVKYAMSQNRKIEIFFEECGKVEDRNLIEYSRSLKKSGMPFDNGGATGYKALSPTEFSTWILGEPHRRSKRDPMLQLADLLVYPIAKAGYDPDYPPFASLRQNKKLIDSLLEPADHKLRGIKYSCFPEPETKRGPT